VPLATRRNNALNRLKLRTERENKTSRVTVEGTIMIDGNAVFSSNVSFIASQSRPNDNN
jgi:hypothetical protein